MGAHVFYSDSSLRPWRTFQVVPMEVVEALSFAINCFAVDKGQVVGQISLCSIATRILEITDAEIDQLWLEGTRRRASFFACALSSCTGAF